MRNPHPDTITAIYSKIDAHGRSKLDNVADPKVEITPEPTTEEISELTEYACQPFQWQLPEGVEVQIMKTSTNTESKNVIDFQPPSCLLLSSSGKLFNSEGGFDMAAMFDMAVKSSNLEPSDPNLRKISYMEALRIGERFSFYFLFQQP